MRAALVLTLIATSALAQRVCERSCDETSRRSKRGGAYCPPVSFCDVLQLSDRTGPWWCVNGDGTQPPGSQTFTPEGVLTPEARTSCGSSPARQANPSVLVTAVTTGYNSSPAFDWPASPFTTCALARLDASSPTGKEFARQQASCGYSLKEAAGNFPSMTIIGTGSVSTTVTGAVAMTTGVWYLVCGRYDGTNLSVCLNGTCSTPVAHSAPILPCTGGVVARVFRWNSTARQAALRGAFTTSKYLDDASIAAMYAASCTGVSP